MNLPAQLYSVGRILVLWLGEGTVGNMEIEDNKLVLYE